MLDSLFRRGDAARFRYRGVELEIPKRLLTSNMQKSFDHKYYEAAEADALPKILTDGDIVMEVGGGVGFISTLCKMDPRVKEVHTFEANPALVPVIARTGELNRVDLNVYDELLLGYNGHASFYVSNDFWASSTRKHGQEITVPCRKLEERLAEIRPTVLIVDIEGGEQTFFDGADLSGIDRIMLELHSGWIGGAGVLHVFQVLSDNSFYYDQANSSGAIVTFRRLRR